MIARNLFQRPRHEPPQPFISMEEVKNNLEKLCRPPNPRVSAQGRRISEKDVRAIQLHLQLLDRHENRFDDHRWALRPRLYAILHRIGAPGLLNNFISESLNDFNLPFNQQTMPPFMIEKGRERLCHDFFSVQDYYLTDAKDIESKNPLHLILSVSGDSHFIPVKTLGNGCHGGVDLVYSRLSTERYVRKRVLRARGSELSQQYLIQELREFRRIYHRHCVKIIGSYTDTEYIVYLMKPGAEMTLEEFLAISSPLDSDQDRKFKLVLRRFYGCLAGAMNYLHANKVHHGDLTSRNILVDSDRKVYINDFGSSYNWSSKPTSPTKHRNVPTSPDYMAPELSKGKKHGTKSDMWSLGLVFLEMTTRLLNSQTSEMKSKIRDHAQKTRSQPYPYANIPAVHGWIRSLGKRAAQFDHDKEPLNWIRKLLHAEYEHRLTPPQLRKSIAESSLLGVFYCIECQEEFLDESFADEHCVARRQNSDSKQESKPTREAVAALFNKEKEPILQFKTISTARSNSTNQWLDDSTQSQPSLFSEPVEAVDEPWDEGADTVLQSKLAEEFLYSLYEHEFYDSSHPVRILTSSDLLNDFTTSSTDLNSASVPVEQLGAQTMRAERYVSDDVSQSNRKSTAVRERLFQDTGLGFLEYESNSSDDDERSLRPFEEISDKSSEVSEDDVLANANNDPILSSFLQDDSPGKETHKAAKLNDGFLFEEEEDKSESENPWDEASDRSESGAACPDEGNTVA